MVDPVRTEIVGSNRTTMKIDNYPHIRDRPTTPKESEFWKKLTAILVKEPDMEYADVVHAYRQLEDEFVKRADEGEVDALETKRHITERILRAAHDAEQPFDVCRDAWNALVELGFSSIDTYCNMAWFYAKSCMFNGQYDTGIDVLDLVSTEIHRRCDEPGLIKWKKDHFDEELTTLGKLRDGLVAFQTSEEDGIAWNDRNDAADDAGEAHWMKREGRTRELDSELGEAIDAISNASWRRSFAETNRDYRQLEADFVTRLQGSDVFFIPETKRRIRSAILMDAHKHKQPFDVCRDAWNDLGPLEFRNILQKSAMAWFYADCCAFNKEPHAGLAVVEPLIAELRKLSHEDTDADELESYQAGLARLERLRDKLQAIPQ